ncbi:hypothetical protein [Flavobacterium sp. FlaQc-28]|uniref:hypothetical protein n=1 Tax=Flavobacterium sp. FlaQc-28 TaxID=3374178 RepID=UPI003757B4C5
MALERENILTLIGSRRYHSCILTTFSFDFYFFEMKAMKWLRSCGVRNVNVFIDGHYYSELMQQATGEEMQLTAGYSLYPVFQKSIFHPKIWMLFGDKEGLLIVGSGNLTSSGNGNNDEIWGAFHFDIRSPENAPIFSSAWNYLSMLSSTVKGQMNEKTTRWIVEHSKWLNELPKVKPFQFSQTSQKEKVAFLFNSETSSIWEELLKHISNEKVIEITSISPFYDSKGKVLQELKSFFPKAEINVVLDESGFIPSLMEVNKTFTFYDWRDAGVSKVQYAKSEYAKSKLHGKIIHFKTKNGKEFCLFGSANVTPEGIGLAGKNSNAEISLLIQSENGGLLNGLGIKLKIGNSKKLSDFAVKNNKSIYETVIKNNKFKVQLLSAELIYDELTLHTNGNFTEQFQVIFFDRQNRYLHSQIFPKFEQELKLRLNLELGTFQYVQLANNEGEVISNKLLISDYFLLAKTHPNPKTEDIERIYSEIQNGELSKVLDLLHYAIIDETENEEGTSILHKNKNTDAKRDGNKEPEKLYDLSSYRPIEHSAYEKSLLLSSLSLRVLDVLKFIHSKALSTNRQADISIDEQEENLGNINGNEENEVKTVRNLSFALLKSERRKLVSYFDNLFNNQQAILYGDNRPKAYKPTLTDLTKYLIALELMFEYGGKAEKYDEQDKQHFFSYLPFADNYDSDNVKGCCLNLVGDFLMLAKTGFKEYEFDYTKKKVEELKDDAFVNTVVCLVNNRWKDDELHYFFSMMLNTLHYLGWKNVDDFNNNIEELKTKINYRISQLKQRANGLEQNLELFDKKVCPAFEKVIQQLADKNFDTSAVQGQIIYKSPWGYSYVHSVSKTNDFTLIRPGFMWDDDKEDYIKHSPDEIYLPVKLLSFICINL